MVTAGLRRGPGRVNSWDTAGSEAYLVKREAMETGAKQEGSDSGTKYGSRMIASRFPLHSRSSELLPVLPKRLEEGYWNPG